MMCERKWKVLSTGSLGWSLKEGVSRKDVLDGVYVKESYEQ